MVRFDRVGLRYPTPPGPAGPGPEALHDISFALPEGSFHWLVGPSGAGKSSLLRLMHLALRPTRGEVEVLGLRLAAARRAALPRLRLRIGGRAEAQIRAEAAEMLRWVGLEDRAEALPATLSGGEQQRVAIARAVV